MSSGSGPTRADVDALLLRTAWLEVGQRIERSVPGPSDVPFSVASMMTPRAGAGRRRRGGSPSARTHAGGGWDESAHDPFDRVEPIVDDLEPPTWPWPWPGAQDPLGELPCGDLPWGACAGLVGGAGAPSRRPSRIVDELDPEDLDFGPARLLADLEPSEVGIEVSDAFTTCERELVARVWGALRQNVDLVEWAMCMSPNAMEDERSCLRQMLTDATEPLTIVPEDEGDDCLGPKGNAWGMKQRRGKIVICTLPGSPFARATELWCGCTDPTARACAVFSMATTLLHELSHSCGWQHDAEVRRETGILKRCQEVFLLQQSFAYAVFQRYPEAAASRCCVAWATTFPGSGERIGGLETDCECDRPVSWDPLGLAVPARRAEAA